MLTNLLDSYSVNQAGQFLQQATRVVILTHMSPDGDALGSALAMNHYLHQIGKVAHVLVPNSFPDFLSWMPGAEQIVIYEAQAQIATNLMDEADLIVCTDFNEPKRIGVLGEKLIAIRARERHVPIILIDHHLHPAPMADITFSYPEMPSSSELVYRLLKQVGDLSLNSAICIYTGMMTDTGNFSFNSNFPDTYEIIGDLVRIGVDKDAIYNLVNNGHTVDRMRLMGYCLYRKMRIFPERHAALIYLSRKELYQFNFRSGDAEGLVNLPLQIKDVYYSCFMREDKVTTSEENIAGGAKTKIKISMRSQGNRPVNGFCHEVFGGGGHMNASGGEYYGPLEDAVQAYLDNYKTYYLEN